ncbi:PASTA domain-containing protein [Blastococcus sp. TF02A-35]|nr:PASTA domain-containing protein [Blastococcus sp. TF02A_35]
MVGHDRELLDGRYELHHLIASGGMGEVWRGRDVRLDRAVAVKVLRSEYADDPGFVARFRAEATHAASLSHPNIAAVHDYGETTAEATGERVAYLVMELVEGEPLSARFGDGGPLDTAAALQVLRQAAAALAEAHRAGVVHRDVKPANILIDREGQVKLTDFGIAWSAASVPLTEAGQVIGTPKYMSPEQAVGEAPRPASDVYALGLVGYESLSGHAAFEGDNPVTLALKQVQQEPAPLPAAVPEEVRSLIDGALVKDPDARFPDAEAFLTAIDATLDGGSPQAPSTEALPVTTAPIPAAPAPAAPRPGRAARRRRAPFRRRVVLVPLLFLLLGAAVVGVTLGLPGGDDAPAGPAAAPPPGQGSIVLAAGDHIGRPADEVAADLTALGLEEERIEVVTDEQPPGTVVRLDPAGAPLAAGDTVRLDVSVAPPAPSGAGADADRDRPSTTGAGNGGAVAPAPVPGGATRGAPAAPTGTDGGTGPAPRPSATPAPEETTPASEGTTPAPQEPAPPASDGAEDGGTTTPTTPPGDGSAQPSDEPSAPTSPPAEPEQDAGTAPGPEPSGAAEESSG